MSQDFPIEQFLNLKAQTTDIEAVSNKFAPMEPVASNPSGQGQLHSSEMASITTEILNILQNSIDPVKYNTFFKTTFSVSELDESSATCMVSTEFIKKMILTHYHEKLKNCFKELFGRSYQLQFNVMGSMKSTPTSSTGFTQELYKSLDTATPAQSNIPQPAFKLGSSKTSREVTEQVKSEELKHLSPKGHNLIQADKTFDNFIIGPSNNMAHAFSIAVANNPGESYPQLYIYGGSGLGKTHLLHAICNKIRENSPSKKIGFVTATEFTKEMVAAIQSKTIESFNRKYSETLDVLIIDDVHTLSGRERTQATFFEIFNKLQERGKQLIFTSDKSPKEIQGIEDRIKTRLTKALATDIKQPDFETRSAILKRKAKEMDIFIGEDVINLIAKSVKSNVRELEGKLIRLGAYSDLMNMDIDVGIAKEQLGIDFDLEENVITIESITKEISKYFKLSIGDIRGKARQANLVKARHIAMYMAHKNLGKTLDEIGSYFSKRDHSSVIHAVGKISRAVKEDAQITQQIFEIESNL